MDSEVLEVPRTWVDGLARVLVAVPVHGACTICVVSELGGRQHSGGPLVRPVPCVLRQMRKRQKKKEDGACSPYLLTTGADRLDNINTT
jgi:hypothetical protein